MLDYGENIHPEFTRQLSRTERESLLKQRAGVIWLYGLSGSGKSTLVNALDRRLYREGFLSIILDGDNLRSGLNNNLGFSDQDRHENIRRAAETAKLLLNNGIIVLASFITPRRSLRDLARKIIGRQDILEVYLQCSLARCAQRDVKGLYRKAQTGKLAQLTGRDAVFEEPATADLILDTEAQSQKTCLEQLYQAVIGRIRKP